MKKVEGGKSGKAKMQEQIQVYHGFDIPKKEVTDHAISITNSNEGLLISDNARKRKFVVEDMVDVTRSLISFHCLYVLKME